MLLKKIKQFTVSSDVFLDSSFFKAFVDIDDDFHPEAVMILERLEKNRASLITSNYILDETITLIRVRCGLPIVKKFQDEMSEFSPLKIMRITLKDEKEAWNWFWNEWRDFSFTDCTSFALMKRLGLTRVATFDRHFSLAGFTVES